MKKSGFTLAEVLVAMGLVGILAALTMPTLISNSRNKANASKLASTVNAVESAFVSMMGAQAEDDLARTTWGKSRTAANLGEYLKLNGSGEDFEAFYDSESPFTGGSPSPDIVYMAKSGAILGYGASPVDRSATFSGLGGSVASSIGFLTIDVNGKTLPNTFGRDVFYFRIGNDGMLYPAGSLNFSILNYGNNTNLWNSNEGSMKCQGTLGMGCTARLVENNYEVDY